MEIVFLPGINNTAQSFHATRAALPDAIPTRALDLPAFDTVSAIAQALVPDLPERSILAGHSFGGYAALAVLAAIPDRIAGLVLINSNDWADTPAAAQAREARAQEAEAGDYEKLAAAATANSYHPDSLDRPELMQARNDEVAAYGPARYAAHQRASATRPDRAALLAGFSGPVLVVTADKDVVISSDRQTEMARRLGADQHVIANTGHMLPAEAPDALAQVIADWHRINFTTSTA